MLRGYLREHTNPPVFIISGIITLLFVAVGVIFPAGTGTVASAVLSFITTYFGWFYILAVSFFLIFVVALLFTRWGRIRLGPDDSRPEFGTWAWFAMLFTAGMGIGLVYFGVAEPISHFTAPPVGEGGTREATETAMNLTFFHWGLHPWAVYITLGLALAYFGFRRGLPLKPSAAFYPLIGDRINGPIGHAIDILAVFGTLFGLATSLGLGATQISSGLNTIFSVPDNVVTQVILIAVITSIAVVSVMAGIDKGIRRLALANMYLAIVLAAFVLIVGPTLFILNALAGNIGYYFQNIVGTSFQAFAYSQEGSSWQASWTLFYWGWWISWSPFVGMFIARISYGRTIRSFILGSLLAPTGASFVWFTVFGDTAIRNVLRGGGGGLAEASSSNALFVFLQQLPIANIFVVLASLLGIIVVTLFFATSSDSGSLVVDILTNGGDPNPVWQQRLFWAVLEGVIAAVLLVAGAASGADPLTALQAASVAAGLPFAVVLLFTCWGLVKGLQEERLPSMTPDPARDGAPEVGRARGRQSGATAPQQMSGPEREDR